MNYKLENFDEFLLAKDESIKDMGWIMVINSLDVKSMNIDELTLLKLRIIQKKYTPEKLNKQFRWREEYYSNINKMNLTKSIEKRLKRFSRNNKINAFHKVQQIIKKEYVNKTNSI
jgi:hypothetical protein